MFHATVQVQTENIFIYCWAPELNCKLNYVMSPWSAVDVGSALEILFVLCCIALHTHNDDWLTRYRPIQSRELTVKSILAST